MIIILEDKELKAIQKIIGEKSIFNLKKTAEDGKFTFKDYRCVTSKTGYINATTDLGGTKITVSSTLVDLLCTEFAELAIAMKGLAQMLMLKSDKLEKHFKF